MSKLTFRGIFVVFLCTTLQFPEEASGDKILSLAFVSAKSHKITYERFLEVLATKGHKVTIVSPLPPGKGHPNIRDIQTVKDAEKYSPEMFSMMEKGEEVNPFTLQNTVATFCETAYDHPEVKALLKEKFDLIFLLAVFSECGAGLVHKLNTSLILISPVVAASWIVRNLGGPVPPSFVPGLFSKFGDRMSFSERVFNFIGLFVLGLVQDFSYKPKMEAIYREKLNDSSIPSSDEILKNASLIFSQTAISVYRRRGRFYRT